MTNNTRTFWLSFANEDGFGGVVIIDLDGTKISLDDKWMMPAIRKSMTSASTPVPNTRCRGMSCHRMKSPERFKHRPA